MHIGVFHAQVALKQLSQRHNTLLLEAMDSRRSNELMK